MRPQFHFSAKSGWINDPHGITWRDGEYHAFFQYVPDSTVWAPNCHWGHAVGRDLFSLTELPVAIAPGEGDDGIWTGSLVTDDTGATRIFYTSTVQPDIGIGRVRVATPDDEKWISWTKGDVVAEAPSELDVIAYRDPFVVKEPQGWRMFLGAGLADGTATVLSYRSDDLDEWSYEGIALERSTHEREPVWMGALWECPQIIEVDGRHVMVSSVWDDDVLYYAGYAVGSYRDGVFTAESWGRLTYGPSLYAPSFFTDAAGRPCLTFWMRGVADPIAGWASVHSVPYVLSLDGERLVATPHADLERYRGAVSAAGVDGPAADIVWSPAPEGELTVDAVGLVVKAASDELTLCVGDGQWTMPYRGEVRIVVDGPAVEVSSAGGVFALAVDANDESIVARSASGTLSVWPLIK